MRDQVAKKSQLSMSHQLLPKEEWTKAEDVRRTVESQEMRHRLTAAGPPLPHQVHRGDRDRDGRARGPRVHGHLQEAEQRQRRPLNVYIRCCVKERMIGADERVPRLCNRVYNTTSFEFDTAVWPFSLQSCFVAGFLVLTICRVVGDMSRELRTLLRVM
jgi:hypothetical protein